MGYDDSTTVERESKGIIDYKMDGIDPNTLEIDVYDTIDYKLRDADPIGIRIDIHNKIEKYFAVHSMELHLSLQFVF